MPQKSISYHKQRLNAQKKGGFTMPDKSNGPEYAPENARSADQAKIMTEAKKKKVCIFCQINFEKNKPLNRLGEFDPEAKDWPLLYVWENPYPQEHHARHIIILPKRHIDNEAFNDEITDEEWLQILDARKWACKFFGIKGGGAADRFGERSLNAGTIGHWHYQLQIPDGTGNVKATFFKDKSPAEEARRANRAVYSDKELETIGGFVIKNKHGEFLSEDLHWVLDPFTHVAEAVPHIFDALFDWKIPNIETITFQIAVSTCPRGTWPWKAIPADNVEAHLWEVLAFTLNEEAYKQNVVKGYIYQNEDGLFLSSDFTWEKKELRENAHVHVSENHRRILVGLDWLSHCVIYDAEISADAHMATITGTLLDNHPIKE